MFKDSLSVCIKNKGKILRERGVDVFLPFGSEYSICITNHQNNRALVKISIDGVNVTSGGIIVNGNASVELERYINNGNMDKGNRFKFIEMTDIIENHRGVTAKDGLIEVTYEFESPIKVNSGIFRSGSNNRMCGTGHDWTMYNSPDMYATCSVADATISKYTAGITVPGSESDQKFTTGHFGISDGETHKITLILRGEIDANRVTEPLTVSKKIKCTTCGTKNKSSHKFCKECGTALVII